MRFVGSSMYDFLDNKVLKSVIVIFFRGVLCIFIEIMDYNFLVLILRF